MEGLQRGAGTGQKVRHDNTHAQLLLILVTNMSDGREKCVFASAFFKVCKECVNGKKLTLILFQNTGKRERRHEGGVNEERIVLVE